MIEVLARVGIPGLVEAAVVLDIVEPVACETDRAGAIGARGCDRDRAVDGLFVDARHRQTLPRVLAGLANIDGEQAHVATVGPTAYHRRLSPT